MSFKHIIMGLVLGGMGLTGALAQSPLNLDAGLAEMQSRLSSWEALDHGPGALIQVSQGGEPLLIHHVGHADLDHDIAIGPDTRFHVASVSKQFTAYAIVLLSRRGQVDLDASLTDYIPEADAYAEVSLRDLLAHTHGIRDAISLVGASGMRAEDRFSQHQALALILQQEQMNFAPGEAFAYSNSGFILLSEVVRRVTGQSLAAFTQAEIFTPLGMAETGFVDRLQTVLPNRARSYVWTGTHYGPQAFNYEITGSTGVTTTAGDLAIWAEALDQLAETDPGFYAEFHTLGVLSSGQQTTYAYGQERRVYRGLETWSHGGRDAGFRAFLLRVPSEDLSISFLGNSEDLDSAQTVYAVLDALLSEHLEPVEPDETRPSPEQLQAYEGDYELFPGLVFSLRSTGETLSFAPLGSEAGAEMAAVSDHDFVLNTARDTRLVFDPHNDGPAQSVVYQLGLLGVLPMSRVELADFAPASVELPDYVGRYYSAELNTVYEIVLEEGGLRARHPNLEDIVLTPYQNDLFSSPYVYFQQARFERDETGRVQGFGLSAVLMRDVRFERLP